MTDETVKPDSGGLEEGAPSHRITRKRALILDAARALFFAHGFDGVAIEAVAAQAGVSKVTVYGHFASKEALLAAVVEREGAEFAPQMPDDLPLRALGLRATLVMIGVKLLTFLEREDVVNCSRLMIAQGTRHPALARAFHDAGPGKTLRCLAALLEEAQREGLFADSADVTEAAEAYYALLLGMTQMERWLAQRAAFDNRALQDRAARMTDRFLSAYAG
jgi:TetR/AcrR family transcriptional regulator, mexJK operon transcriptional repressor